MRQYTPSPRTLSRGLERAADRTAVAARIGIREGQAGSVNVPQLIPGNGIANVTLTDSGQRLATYAGEMLT